MSSAICFFCGNRIPLNDRNVFVSHNGIFPEGISACEGSLRKVERN